MFSVILAVFCVISYMMEEDHGNDSICPLITVNSCCSSSSPSFFSPTFSVIRFIIGKEEEKKTDNLDVRLLADITLTNELARCPNGKCNDKNIFSFICLVFLGLLNSLGAEPGLPCGRFLFSYVISQRRRDTQRTQCPASRSAQHTRTMYVRRPCGECNKDVDTKVS